jgi:tetratricopeptide (TPR) repeat protein
MKTLGAAAFAALFVLSTVAMAQETTLDAAETREWLDEVQLLSGQGNYDAAIVLFNTVKERNEDAIQSIDGLKMAVVLAVAASRQDHLEHSRWLLSRFPDPELATDAERAVKGYVLVPWADDADLIAVAVDRCRFAVDQATDAGEPGYLPWFYGSYGMALYRAGEFEKSAEWLEKSAADESPFISSLALAFHAMAEYRNSNTEAAHNSLEGARERVAAFPEPGTDLYLEEWTDILMSKMALAEAEALIKRP